uniref:Uncharacterized protein n=2 Tax=Oryza TaxID=4527 RepID=A0A0D3EPU3_9ORYZ
MGWVVIMDFSILLCPLELDQLSISTFRTEITSAFFTVLRRYSISNALVASSSNKILGFFIIALAIAILCFCPPDN